MKLADILAILAMTMSPDGKRESLNFKLQGETEALGEPLPLGPTINCRQRPQLARSVRARSSRTSSRCSACPAWPTVPILRVGPGALL